MKRTVLPLATAAVLLCGCNESTEAMTTTAATTEVTTTTTAATTVTTTEAAETVTTAAAEPEYVQVSEGNVFIDYRLMEDYQGTTHIGELGAKAVEYLMGTEYYAESTENIGEFTGEEFAPYIQDSRIVPKLRAAYPDDYDGDGEEETFLLADMPYNAGIPVVRSFLIFADKDEQMTLLDNMSAMYPVQLLDYGDFRQIAIGGYGVAGVEDHNSLYGVRDGQVKKLYALRGDLVKVDCFLATYGLQGVGDFMYYDTAVREYRAIAGEKLDMDNVREMDSTGALSEYYDADAEYCNAQLLGGRYYVFALGVMDPGTAYLYEDGAFVRTEECENVRLSRGNGVELVKDIDIDKALAEMVPVYGRVSRDNVFIDYKLIDDYPPSEISGTLGAKAVDFLADSEYYAETEEHLSEFIGKEEFADYFDEGGNIVPRLQAAYPGDYDGDGKTETFLLVDMPYQVFDTYNIVRTFLIFADKDGNFTILADMSDLYPVQLLDYGQFRQIIFGGSGVMGADDGKRLYGVIDGQAEPLYSIRGGFEKADCFLVTDGWQGMGDFMYYDTVRQRYCGIAGEPVPLETIREMDSTGVIDIPPDRESRWQAYFVGKKYYLLNMPGIENLVYLYEDGAFVPSDYPLRDSTRSLVSDLDFDKALAEMISVE